MKAYKQNILLVIFFISIGIILFLAVSSTLFLYPSNSKPSANVIVEKQSNTRMSLSSFDREMAKQFMDKNGDGMCDVCGMDVELCMDSGQIQCNMDSKSTIGILGSQHIHADWKIYISGEPLGDTFFEPLAMDMSKMDSKITSSFIHMDKGAPAPEKTSDVLHMHATGVSLWIFFKSVGMDFNKNCLTMPKQIDAQGASVSQQKFCSDGKNTLKFYVNGNPNSQWENYVFNDGDKILISYGDGTYLTQQLNSITDFAKDH